MFPDVIQWGLVLATAALMLIAVCSVMLRARARRHPRCTHGDCPICQNRSNELQLRSYSQGMRIGRALPRGPEPAGKNGHEFRALTEHLWTRYLT